MVSNHDQNLHTSWEKEGGGAWEFTAPLTAHRAFASIDQSLMTRLGSLLFWCALADILWRAATNQFSNSKKENIISSRLHVPSRRKKLMSFENAVILKSTPLKLVCKKNHGKLHRKVNYF